MLQLATKADRAAVNELAAQVHAMHMQWRPDIYCTAEELYPEERFGECLEKRELYVAKIEGNVVGYALLLIRDYDWNGIVWRKAMIVRELCVHEACRGHGIGKEMMTDVHALAKAFGCTDLEVNVYPQNEAAIRLYESCGLTIRNINMQTKV